jgi:hypothetical protein
VRQTYQPTFHQRKKLKEATLKTSLLKGLNTKDEQELKGLFIEAARLRKRMVDVLEEKYKSMDVATLGKDGYENASWAYKQADAIGYKRAIRELQNLLEN